MDAKAEDVGRRNRGDHSWVDRQELTSGALELHVKIHKRRCVMKRCTSAGGDNLHPQPVT